MLMILVHGIGADSRPICSSMAAVPYLTGKLHMDLVMLEHGNNMNINPEDVMISIPASESSRIVSNLEEMRTKRLFKEE